MGKSVSGRSWVRGKSIGEGCFGTVSLGVSKSDGRVFAIKSVDRATCLPSQLEALENEIRILRSLSSSPCVVRYLGDDDSVENAASYRNLHLEYLPGGTLSDAARVDETTVRSLTWCLVSALKHAHSRGIVHCDVKGKNVLIAEEPGRAKLADFGSGLESSTKVFGPPTVPRGSPLWMAPEVVRREYQGPESDVWSLGCTVVEMVAGSPPWHDGSAAETLRRIGYSEDLPEIPAELSEVGRDFVEKCLRREPARRWSCDRLLQHPFLADAASSLGVDELSPRCVLDGFGSDFDQEENEQSNDLSAIERIGKLTGCGGANWESDDDWTVIRQLSSDSCSRADSEGANWECFELSRAERESVGTSLEHSKFCVDNKAGYFCSNGLPQQNHSDLALIHCFYSLYISVLFSYSFPLLFLHIKFNKLITIYISSSFTTWTCNKDKITRDFT